MTATTCLSLDAILSGLRARSPESSANPGMCASIGGVGLVARSDDAGFLPAFFQMFGGVALAPHEREPLVDLRLAVHAGDGDYGWFHLGGTNRLPLDAHEFSFSLSDEGGLFESLHCEDGWTCLAFRGERVPALAFRDRDCVFARSAQWRETVLWYLFWRVLRLRGDAIFFHASSLGIGGQGTMFIGPGGAGKSTTALALAARGHEFLGDEVAGWLPATGELIPFRRPVGIKPGPRSRSVQQGLAAHDAERIERDGFLRVDVESLMPVPAPRNLPLRRVVFLRGFRAEPRLQRIAAARDHIAALQPLMSSFLNAAHARRVFDLTRLLAQAELYELHPGEPDATARFLEEAFATQ